MRMAHGRQPRFLSASLGMAVATVAVTSTPVSAVALPVASTTASPGSPSVERPPCSREQAVDWDAPQLARVSAPRAFDPETPFRVTVTVRNPSSRTLHTRAGFETQGVSNDQSGGPWIPMSRVRSGSRTVSGPGCLYVNADPVIPHAGRFFQATYTVKVTVPPKGSRRIPFTVLVGSSPSEYTTCGIGWRGYYGGLVYHDAAYSGPGGISCG